VVGIKNKIELKRNKFVLADNSEFIFFLYQAISNTWGGKKFIMEVKRKGSFCITRHSDKHTVPLMSPDPREKNEPEGSDYILQFLLVQSS
jgi:hypothetical protein